MTSGKRIFSPLSVILLMLVPSVLRAADIQVSTHVDRTHATIGEEIELTLTIQGRGFEEPDELTVPDMPDFQIISRQTGISTTIVNFKISTSRNTTYTIAPQKTGQLTIPAFSMKIGGNEYKTSPITIHVTSAPVQKAPPSGRLRTPPTPYSPPTGTDQDARAFLRALATKQRAFVGEQITLEYQIYYNQDLYPRVPNVANISIPEFNGFEVIEFEIPPNAAEDITTGGIRYRKVPFKRYALFPIFVPSGPKVILPPLQLTLVGSRDLFDDFLNMDLFRRRQPQNAPTLALKSPAVEIEIKALPPTTDKDFSGSVGHFSIFGNLENKAYKTGEPITLEITVQGKGRVLKFPDLHLPDGLEAYEPTVKKSSSVADLDLEERKDFTYLIIPKKPGTYRLENVSYLYFDTEKGGYETLRLPPLSIEAAGAPISSETASVDKTSPTIQQTLRYIKPDLPPLQPRRPVNHAMVCLIVQFFGFLITFLFWRYQAYRKKILSNPMAFRKTIALKTANTLLADAHSALAKNKKGEAAQKLEEALLRYVADRFGLAGFKGLTNQEIERCFREHHVPAETQNHYLGLKSFCEAVRWSGDFVSEIDWKNRLDHAKTVFHALESSSS